MDENYFKFYHYELEDISIFKGKKVYVISFKPKNNRKDRNPGFKGKVWKRTFFKAEFKGKIYIDIETFAFVCFQYNLANVYKYKDGDLQHLKYDVYVDYKKYNGKWIVNQIQKTDMQVVKYKGYNQQVTTDTLTAFSHILVNDISETTTPFKEEEIFPQTNRMALFNYKKEYNPDFWENFNTILPTEFEKKIISDLSKDEKLPNQFMTSQIRDTSLKPPVAKEILQSDTLPFEIVTDNYAWFKNYGSKEAIEYLVKENKYAENYMNTTSNLQTALFSEMLKYSATDERIGYVKHGKYFYYEREKDDFSYKELCRKKDSINNPYEEVLINLNNLAVKYEYFSVGDYRISPNNKFIEYWIDTKGNEIYKSFFFDIEKKCNLEDSIENLWEIVWIDDKSFIYSKDNEVGITNSIYIHKLGEEQENDKLILKVPTNFILGISADTNTKTLFVTKTNGKESEISIMNFSDLNYSNAKIISKMREEHLYFVQPKGDSLFILSNKNNLYNQIFYTTINNLDEKYWKLVFPNKDSITFQNFKKIGDFFIFTTMKNASEVILIYNYKINQTNYIDFNIPGKFKILKLDEENQKFKFTYSNFKIPLQEFTYYLKTHTYIMDYEQKSYLNPKLYEIERIWVNSRDNIKIPVTLFYKKRTGIEPNTDMKLVYNIFTKDFNLKNNNKMLLTAYGGGLSFDMRYNASIIPLVNKDFIYAIAHVRGGFELGKHWYLAGSKLNKKNTFNDFIDCTRFLIREKYTSPENLSIEGASAGGTLIGNVINQNPELFKLAIIEVPSLDIIDATCDTNYRLQQYTINELGNPEIEEEYNYLKSYSPYQNVKNQKYPNILLSSGYLDQRVQPYQAAKYIAKLRKMNTSNSIILFKTNMQAGHIGSSGSNDSSYEAAYKYAFLLDRLNQ